LVLAEDGLDHLLQLLAPILVVERVLDAERVLARVRRRACPHDAPLDLHRISDLGRRQREDELGADGEIALALDGDAALRDAARVVAEQRPRRRVADGEANRETRVLAATHAAHRILRAMAASMLGQRLGRYELQEELGRGAMATVYRAVDTTLGRAVAVKVLHTFLVD